jgi:predicted RNase H-related nuclease YkuK (DUF458 family)
MNKLKLTFIAIIIFSLSACSILNMNSKSIEIKNDNYVVKVKYPKLQSPDNQRLLKKFILSEITKFQASYGTDDEGYRHKLKINYKIYNSVELKSIVFRVRVFEEDEIENLYFKTFVFNKKTEKQVLISDILDSELKVIVAAQILRDKLEKLIPTEFYDEARVLRGTDAQAKNFKDFYYKNNNLHVIFSPFAVADFDAGYYDIVVKFSAK